MRREWSQTWPKERRKDGPGGRALDLAGLDLTMAVGANEDAFLDLLAVSGECLRRLHRETEALGRRIDVVEMEVDDAAVVAADRAGSASFVDEGPFDLLLPAGDRLSHATLAAPLGLRLAVQGELNKAVMAACTQLDWLAPGRRGGSSSSLDQRNGRAYLAAGHERMFAWKADATCRRWDSNPRHTG